MANKLLPKNLLWNKIDDFEELHFEDTTPLLNEFDMTQEKQIVANCDEKTSNRFDILSAENIFTAIFFAQK